MSSTQRVVGSGVVATEARAVSGFRGISLRGIGHLTLERSDSESLTITAEDNLLPLLESDVREEILMIGPLAVANLVPTREIIFRVTYRTLNSIRASGISHTVAAGIDVDHLSIVLSGVSTMAVDGNADRQTLVVSGTSQYQGEDLATRDTSVDASGMARLVVNVRERLEGKLSGASALEYLGSPEVAVSVAGASAVRPR